MAGKNCPMCGSSGGTDNGFGLRILAGEYADVYLQRRTPLPGYSVAIWKQDHVAEVTDLEAVKATGYWNEVMRAGRAIRTLFEPAKLNYLTLGNAVPHLHSERATVTASGQLGVYRVEVDPPSVGTDEAAEFL